MVKPYFDEELERLPAPALAVQQLVRLQESVERAYTESRFYRALYEEGGVVPADVQNLEDIQNLPFLDGDALRDAYPHGLITAPRRDLLDLFLSQLSSGRRTMLFATDRDHERHAQWVARSLWMQGLRDTDILLDAQPNEVTGAPLAIRLGAHCLGALVVTASDATLDSQLDALRESSASALATSGTHALALLDRAQDCGIDLSRRSSRIRMAVLSADADSESASERFQEELDVPALISYGLPELLPACLASECPERGVRHVWADAFLVECVDPRTGDWLPPGKPGELVWTALQSDACALIRLRSGTVATLLPSGECACGRTHPRVGPILGRLSDAVTVSGTLLFPDQVEEALRSFPEFGGAFHLKVERPRSLDRFTVLAELTEPQMATDRTLTRRLMADMSQAVLAATHVAPIIELLPPGGLAAATAEPAPRRRRVRTTG